MSKKIEHGDISEKFSPKERRQTAALIALGGFALTALVGSIFYTARHSNDTYQARLALDAKAFAPARADGFELTSADSHYSPKGFKVVIDLGNCTLAADVERTMLGDEVTDLHNYSFDGYAMATTKEGREKIGKTYHSYTYNDGVPVTFTFENRADLEANILGSEPCKTLAQTYEPATSTARR